MNFCISYSLENMVDSHCHLVEMKNKEVDIDSFFKTFYENKMGALLDIGIEPDDLSTRITQFGKYKSVYFAAAIYPGHTEQRISPESDQKQTVNFETLQSKLAQLKNEIELNRSRVCAIGECGLDFFKNYGSVETQIYLFEEQLKLANEFNLPVLIHNRNADEQLLSSIQKIRPKRGGILHCYSSDRNFAYKAIDEGFKISFAGNITYKNSHSIADTAKQIPLNSILVETDSPYLSPGIFRGKTNIPLYIGETYQKIASLRAISCEKLIDCVKKNWELFINTELN